MIGTVRQYPVRTTVEAGGRRGGCRAAVGRATGSLNLVTFQRRRHQYRRNAGVRRRLLFTLHRRVAGYLADAHGRHPRDYSGRAAATSPGWTTRALKVGPRTARARAWSWLLPAITDAEILRYSA